MLKKHEEDAKIFKALSDARRLAILAELRTGEKCACKLSEPSGLTQSGVSYHMKILCDAGIVLPREEGVWTHYRLNREGCEKAKRLLDELTYARRRGSK